MLLQRAGTGTIPPTGFVPPVWDILADAWNAAPAPKTAAVTLGPETISMGHDDDEEHEDSTDVVGHDFGWDNEQPKRDVHVGRFRIEWRPVTNGEFYEFYTAGGKDKVQFPATWIEVDGAVQVNRLRSVLSVYRLMSLTG